MLLSQNKTFHLPEVFAIQLLILLLGLGQGLCDRLVEADVVPVVAVDAGAPLTWLIIISRSKVLQVQNISLALGGKQILRDLSFEIRDIYRPETVTGQVGLLGPSGMGKTQLFHVLAGLKKPDSGRCWWAIRALWWSAAWLAGGAALSAV